MRTSIIKDAFKVKKTPFPMRRAIGAALSASIPVIIGILFGSFQYGLIAGIGGFAYLYVFNETYRHLAKKVFFVMLGLAGAMGLGTLTADSPILFSVLLGLIGGIVTFVFGALKIKGPAAIFFVIIFAMTSAMEINPDAALQKAVLVFAGGSVAWIVAMIGWFSDPYEPEKKSIYRLYQALFNLAASTGTVSFNAQKEKTLFALKDAETTLASGYIPWRSTAYFKRLYVLNERAHEIWGGILELESEGRKETPAEIAVYLKQIAESLDKGSEVQRIGAHASGNLNDMEKHLIAKTEEANVVLHEPMEDRKI